MQDGENGETMSREPISKRLRFEVFKRDSFTCQYCGAHPPAVVLECDHIVPASKGGSTDEENLVTACFACNRGKSDVSLQSVPRSLNERRIDIQEREEQIAGYEAVMRHRRERIDSEAHQVLEKFCELYVRDSIPKVDFTSIKRFIEKLGLNEVLVAVDIAHQKRRYSYSNGFKYFCGVCWSKIKNGDFQQ